MVRPDNRPVLQILTVTFPFFALVLAGYTAARARLLPLEAIPGLNTFVLYFALPCMLYRFGAQTPIERLLDARVAGVWLACGLAVVATWVRVVAVLGVITTPWKPLPSRVEP